MVIHPGFAPLLSPWDVADLDAAHGSICGLWPTLALAFVNRAWGRFAADNGGPDVVSRWPLGAAVLSSTPEPLRAFYRSAFAGALATGQPWDHDYECSSPSTRRLFHMRAVPLKNGTGLIVKHMLRFEEPHPGVVHEAADLEYLGEDGLIQQCAHCRTVRHARHSTRWDWVPFYVARPKPNISHALCPVCDGHYFPRA